MTLLLIDAGNSRLKWATLRRGHLGRAHAAPWSAAALPRVCQRIMAGAQRPTSIWVASVAGARVQRALRAAARARAWPVPRFVHSAGNAAGVINGYRRPAQLGVDRWLALLAVRAAYPGEAACVVSLGTAITIDLLDAGGRHRGGAIAPGAALMSASLQQGTALLRQRARAPGERADALFARDTRAAIGAGTRQAAAALVAEAFARARERTGTATRLILTGGAARELQTLLRRKRGLAPAVRVDDLVLRGLAVLAREK
jgi:type III pantothenate kinase